MSAAGRKKYIKKNVSPSANPIEDADDYKYEASISNDIPVEASIKNDIPVKDSLSNDIAIKDSISQDIRTAGTDSPRGRGLKFLRNRLGSKVRSATEEYARGVPPLFAPDRFWRTVGDHVDDPAEADAEFTDVDMFFSFPTSAPFDDGARQTFPPTSMTPSTCGDYYGGDRSKGGKTTGYYGGKKTGYYDGKSGKKTGYFGGKKTGKKGDCSFGGKKMGKKTGKKGYYNGGKKKGKKGYYNTDYYYQRTDYPTSTSSPSETYRPTSTHPPSGTYYPTYRPTTTQIQEAAAHAQTQSSPQDDDDSYYDSSDTLVQPQAHASQSPSSKGSKGAKGMKSGSPTSSPSAEGSKSLKSSSLRPSSSSLPPSPSIPEIESCTTDRGCSDDTTYCSLYGVCAPFGGCYFDADCALENNRPYPIVLCVGELKCSNEGQCMMECTEIDPPITTVPTRSPTIDPTQPPTNDPTQPPTNEPSLMELTMEPTSFPPTIFSTPVTSNSLSTYVPTSSESTETPTATLVETNTEASATVELDCVDDPEFLYVGNPLNDCQWVASRPVRCQLTTNAFAAVGKKTIADFCRATCRDECKN